MFSLLCCLCPCPLANFSLLFPFFICVLPQVILSISPFLFSRHFSYGYLLFAANSLLLSTVSFSYHIPPVYLFHLSLYPYFCHLPLTLFTYFFLRATCLFHLFLSLYCWYLCHFSCCIFFPPVHSLFPLAPCIFSLCHLSYFFCITVIFFKSPVSFFLVSNLFLSCHLFLSSFHLFLPSCHLLLSSCHLFLSYCHLFLS